MVADPAGAQSTTASRNPSGLDAQISNGHAVLTWTPGSHPRATGQRIVRREPRQAWATVADVAVDAATYTDTSIVKGRKYIYRVQYLIDDRARGASNRAVIEPAQNPAPATTTNPSSLSGRLSGGSVMPRFFWGDPNDAGWTSQTKVNNGGLRWLKHKAAALKGS